MELYRVTNITAKPRRTTVEDPSTDIRTAAEMKGHAISFRGARGGAILLAPGESQVTDEITNSLKKLEQRGLVTIQNLSLIKEPAPAPAPAPAPEPAPAPVAAPEPAPKKPSAPSPATKPVAKNPVAAPKAPGSSSAPFPKPSVLEAPVVAAQPAEAPIVDAPKTVSGEDDII